MYNYNPYSTEKYPIRARSHETAGFTRTVEGYDCLLEINRNVLRHFVLLALDDRKMLSPRKVSEEDLIEQKKDSEKTFTRIVYGDDINHRHGGQVFFANQHDVDKLMSFLEEKVGRDCMKHFERNVNGKPDDVERIGMEYYMKWKASDAEWPLK
jgi:hypothetical protein